MASETSRGRRVGIDLFKVAAALLVVAIHTGPLLTYGETADFMLTGVVGRLAVPFFFAAAGYLLFRKLTGVRRRDIATLWRYSGKVALLYAIATLLFIPFNLYKGEYGAEMTIAAILQDVVWDGTFYHLWYLPALIVGIWIVYGLYAWLPARLLLPAALLLYVPGLLGDSYYGLAVRSEALREAYGFMWSIFDYTRNGVFFAPIFLALGLRAALRAKESRPTSACLVALSAGLPLLVLEALLLHEAGWPRHDSMYLGLVPAVYALLHLALRMKVRIGARLGDRLAGLSLWVYILHPAAIVAVRMAAKLTGTEALLIEHSLVHYIVVCVVSFAIADIIARGNLYDSYKSSENPLE